jgi:TonB family protein
MKRLLPILLLVFSVEVAADYLERYCYDPATGRGFISFVECRGIEKEITKEEYVRLRDCNFAKGCALASPSEKQSAPKGDFTKVDELVWCVTRVGLIRETQAKCDHRKARSYDLRDDAIAAYKRLMNEKTWKENAKREKESQLQEQREVEEARQRDQAEAYSAIGALVGRIGAKVRENWNKPPGSMTGLETVISVKVQRTGEVVSVKVVKSSGNHYFDQSAENAVYKASPLPFPDEPRYYEFIKEFNFKFVPDQD